MDAAFLQTHFQTLGLPQEASEYLLDLWHVIQLLDDAADGDKNPDASNVAWAIFARMPTNRFFVQSQATLQPLLVMQLIKWEAANAAETEGRADEKSYMWRAGYYEIVSMACHLCGCDAQRALSLYGDLFADYRAEFPEGGE